MFPGAGHFKSRAFLVGIFVTAVLLLPAAAAAQPEAEERKIFRSSSAMRAPD